AVRRIKLVTATFSRAEVYVRVDSSEGVSPIRTTQGDTHEDPFRTRRNRTRAVRIARARRVRRRVGAGRVGRAGRRGRDLPGPRRRSFGLTRARDRRRGFGFTRSGGVGRARPVCSLRWARGPFR